MRKKEITLQSFEDLDLDVFFIVMIVIIQHYVKFFTACYSFALHVMYNNVHLYDNVVLIPLSRTAHDLDTIK